MVEGLAGDVSGTGAPLIYIHIGKCGGTSLFKTIQDSPVVARSFSRIDWVHIVTPAYRPEASYVVVLRNPVSRALSAFNWRYRLVVEEGGQKTRFAGEY